MVVELCEEEVYGEESLIWGFGALRLGERYEGNGWWGTKGWERILKISRKFGEMLHWLGIKKIRKEKR